MVWIYVLPSFTDLDGPGVLLLFTWGFVASLVNLLCISNCAIPADTHTYAYKGRTTDAHQIHDLSIRFYWGASSFWKLHVCVRRVRFVRLSIGLLYRKLIRLSGCAFRFTLRPFAARFYCVSRSVRFNSSNRRLHIRHLDNINLIRRAYARNMFDTSQTCLYFTISFINAIPDAVIYVIEAICAHDRGNDTIRKCRPLRVHIIVIHCVVSCAHLCLKKKIFFSSLVNLKPC